MDPKLTVAALIEEVDRLRRRLSDLEAERATAPAESGASAELALDALMRHIPDGITIADAPDVTIRRVSDYGVAVTQRARETLEGIPAERHSEAWQVYYPDRRTLCPPEALPLTRATKSGEVVRNEEFILRLADGTEMPVLCNAGPIRDADGKLTGGVVAWRDIDDLKRAQRAVEESRERLRLAQAAAKLGIYDHDLVSGRIDCDARMRELWSVPRDMPISYELFMSGLHRADRAVMQAAVECALNPDGTGEYGAEYRVIGLSDGVERWIAGTGRVVFAESTPVRLVGTVSEITERKRAEAALRDVSTELRRTLDTAAAGLTRCSRDLRYLSANPAYARLVGIPLEQIVGRPIVEVMGAEAFEVIRPHVERVLRGERVEYEAELPCAAGHLNSLHVIYTPDTDDEGTIVGWVASVSDITDRKRAEEELRRAKAAAERASAEKTRFLATASHDLRQPLQALGLSISRLAARVEGDEKSARLAARADRAAKSLADLLNALLDVAQLDAGRIVPRVVDFPVADILEAIRDEFDALALSSGLRFEVKNCQDIIRGDPALLGRMVRNLVSNAMKYTPAGGEVTITCAKSDDGLLGIAVADTGVGIAKDQHAAVFEDFRQLGNPQRDRSKGLGLGLSIVARMARLLDHPVSLRSAPGQGSVFTVAVPLGEAVQTRRPAEALEVRGAGRILLVEDEELVADLLREILDDAGFDVLFAPTAEAAFRLLDGIGPGEPPLDAIIADYRLPGLTGLDAVLAARRRFPLIPAVLVTGDTFEQQLRGVEAQGIKLLQKPVHHSVVMDVLRDIAAQGEAISSPTR